MNYIYIKEIDSTQTYLKEHLHELPDETWLCAGFQTHGKGQFDRSWQSEANQNILCSLLLKQVSKEKLFNIQYKVSGFMMDVLKQYHIISTFKAPNDIYYENKKLCGILVDTKVSDHNIDVIIGIGLNVNQTSFEEQLNATSMQLITSQLYDLNAIMDHIKTLKSHLL